MIGSSGASRPLSSSSRTRTMKPWRRRLGSHLWPSWVKRRWGGRPPPSQGRLPRTGTRGRQGMEDRGPDPGLERGLIRKETSAATMKRRRRRKAGGRGETRADREERSWEDMVLMEWRRRTSRQVLIPHTHQDLGEVRGQVCVCVFCYCWSVCVCPHPDHVCLSQSSSLDVIRLRVTGCHGNLKGDSCHVSLQDKRRPLNDITVTSSGSFSPFCLKEQFTMKV